MADVITLSKATGHMEHIHSYCHASLICIFHKYSYDGNWNGKEACAATVVDGGGGGDGSTTAADSTATAGGFWNQQPILYGQIGIHVSIAKCVR